MITVNCCSAKFGGLKTSHCTSCHETFSTITGFDKHRTGSHAKYDRHCLPPASVGLVDARRSYPCWAFPPKQLDSDGLSPTTQDNDTGEEEQ